MDKIEKVEGLSLEQLKKILGEIIPKEGFNILRFYDNVLVANIDNPISQITNIFIVCDSQLSGVADTNEIYNTVIREKREHSANNVTVVAKNHISKGFQTKLDSLATDLNIKYIGRDELIGLINKDYPEFWKHDDLCLLKYESEFSNSVKQENQLRLLKLPVEKCQKLLDVFINPQLISYEEDSKTHTLVRKRNDINGLVEEDNPVIISGGAGTGKSTLLKKVGLAMIERNQSNTEIKSLPVYITALELLNSNYMINEAVESKTKEFFQTGDTEELARDYRVCLLIDSIDEFDINSQKKVLSQLQGLYDSQGIRYFIGTRESDQIENNIQNKNVRSYEISKFNLEQIKRFVSAFFSGDNTKADNLLEALRENKIIERLPITPLTLSLISILYDETNFEIPATITDIYDNFNALIVGKAVVSSKVEFIDVSFKERILSLYALLLMERENHEPFTVDDFISHFAEYFRNKTLPIKDAQLEDVLKYIIHNTGILYLKDGRWVVFTHDSYMEYYAAVEIFKFKREKEKDLVDKFFDFQWQNVAVFYAGMTKDMPDFANKINEKLSKCDRWYEYVSGIQGCGYLLQALYQTDNVIRRDLVLTALKLVLESNEVMKKISSEKMPLFKNYGIPILEAINFIHFYEMFNSITLKTPLQLSYETLKKELDRIVASEVSDKSQIPIIGYKLLDLAFTLGSKRINDSRALEEIMFHSEILKDPNLYIIADFTLEIMEKTEYVKMRKELQREYLSSTYSLKACVGRSTSKIRFSVLDTVTADRNVKIFVEGKTDAQILEHAFMILTDGRTPYWKTTVASSNGDAGGFNMVTKKLEAAFGYSTEYSTIIGIYDHDDGGLSGFRGLNKDSFGENQKDLVKKHKDAEVYAITLPIPKEMGQYLHKEQRFNMFSIEHYFGHDYLKGKGMLKDTPIPDVFEINKKKKEYFANEICKEDNPERFRYFTDLFKIIDDVSKMEIDYIV